MMYLMVAVGFGLIFQPKLDGDETPTEIALLQTGAMALWPMFVGAELALVINERTHDDRR